MSKITQVLAALTLAFTAACGDDGGASTKDAAPHDAGVDAPANTGPDANCIATPDPTKHLEIINACTSATKIYKDSHPALTLPDGGLPALPGP